MRGLLQEKATGGRPLIAHVSAEHLRIGEARAYAGRVNPSTGEILAGGTHESDRGVLAGDVACGSGNGLFAEGGTHINHRGAWLHLGNQGPV